MTDSKSTRNKHLTFDDRKEIEECLDKSVTFKNIARRIGKDPTTVSKEVKKHLFAAKPEGRSSPMCPRSRTIWKASPKPNCSSVTLIALVSIVISIAIPLYGLPEYRDK